VVAHLLILLGVVTVAGGAALAQMRNGLFDSDTFAERLADSLTDSRVSAYVAEEITGAVLHEKPDLVAVRPLLLSTAQGVVSSDAFQSMVRVTARETHAAVTSQGGRSLLLSVPDVGVVLRGALANASPGLAARIPAQVSTAIARLGDSGASRFIVDMWQLGRTLAWAAWASVGGGLVLLVLGIALAPSRSKALRRASIDLTLAGLIILLLLPAARALISTIPDEPLAQQATAGFFDAFTHGLRRLAFVLGGVGLVFTAAAHSLLQRSWLPDKARAIRTWLLRPRPSTWQNLLRGALLVLAGVGMVVRPDTALTTLAILGGTLLAFLGLEQLFRLAMRALPQELAEDHADPGTETFTNRRAVLLLAVAAGLAIVIVSVSRPKRPSIVRASRGCNGDVRLCDKPLDQVVFAGTHNAMASAAGGSSWMFSAHERDISAQLDDGVRAFLIDVYAGVPVSGRIKTDIGASQGFMRDVERALGPEGVEAAKRIRERLVGPPEGPRALYLCHGFCELGAEPLVPWLRTLRGFLADHPREVVILVLEDYVPPEEIAAAFAESGLDDLVYRGSPRPPWPTLAEMADTGQRVVTFLESGNPGVDWMFPAFQSIQETPYRFRRPDQFSCGANRGGTAGSLFQLNHWIETPPTPRPSNAAIVNAYDFLLGRAQRCQFERHHLPNIVAVDFYRTGDLLKVVKHLNGIDVEKKK
jgi:hypothetical protein